MNSTAPYEQLEAAAKKIAAHRVLKDILRIRPALVRDGTLLDSPAGTPIPPCIADPATPCAASAPAGESTSTATLVDMRRMAASFAFVDASVLLLAIGYAIGRHL
jgi:hypothetical protein